MKSITFKKTLWVGLLVALVCVMLTKCNSCSSEAEDKKSAAETTEATPEQKKELKMLQTIAAAQKRIAELEAQRGVAPIQPVMPPVFQPTVQLPVIQPAVNTLPVNNAIFPINRINPPSRRDSQEVMNLRAQIRAQQAAVNMKIANWVGTTDAVQHHYGQSVIREMQAELADMNAQLVDAQAAQ